MFVEVHAHPAGQLVFSEVQFSEKMTQKLGCKQSVKSIKTVIDDDVSVKNLELLYQERRR